MIISCTTHARKTAQREFVEFLCPLCIHNRVIHRLVVMIDTQATLEAKVPGSSSGARTSTQKKTD